MSYRHKRRKPMASINVVPYIDVMLVLLIIFMVTAPLLTQGIKVDLPQATAEPLPSESKTPIVVSVDVTGDYFIDVGDGNNEKIDLEALRVEVATRVKQAPTTPVVVKGDRTVAYEQVVRLMVELQAAGVPSVGLMTEMPEK
ncbi:MAG: protein TolR [Corallincola sp.]|nr:protein TolR [Corallincola sp.]